MNKTYKKLQYDNHDVQVQSAIEDGVGKNIEDNYAKQDGYYDELTAGLAENLISTTLVSQKSEYVFRPTANNVSIESGKAELNYIKGNIVEPLHLPEGVTPLIPETWYCSFNPESFILQCPNYGTYTFTALTTGSGYEVTFHLVGTDGTDLVIGPYPETYNYGFIMGVFSQITAGETATIYYSQGEIGTFTTINPTQFKSVGFNLYNHSTGTARLVGNNTYKIVGSYSSLSFIPFGSETAQSITPNDGVFTVSEGGVLTVIDGDATTTMVYLPWSYIDTSFDYAEYSESTISIPNVDKDGNALRNNSSVLGFIPAVIIDGEVIAQDIINLQEKKYIANVEYITYSAANLATVQALPNVKYIYDENTIIYVSDNTKPQVIELANTVTNSYIVNDFGTEEFVGVAYNSTIGVPCQNEYGDNLKDKLRSDVLTISAQELTTEQQTQVKQNLGLEITTGVDAFGDLY